MSGNWDVRLGSLWRTFKVQGRRASPFVKSGRLSADQGRLELTTQYDPPGSGWLALGAALVTGILVALVAQATGGCAGPGWLLWFIGIALLRRRKVTINLQEADATVIDPANRRLAFQLNFEGKRRWVAVELPQNFDEAAQAVATQMPGRTVQDNINRALTSGSIALIVSGILFGVLILVSVIAAFFFMAVRPSRTPSVAPSLITFAGLCVAPLAMSFSLLPKCVRRILCTEE